MNNWNNLKMVKYYSSNHKVVRSFVWVVSLQGSRWKFSLLVYTGLDRTICCITILAPAIVDLIVQPRSIKFLMPSTVSNRRTFDKILAASGVRPSSRAASAVLPENTNRLVHQTPWSLTRTNSFLKMEIAMEQFLGIPTEEAHTTAAVRLITLPIEKTSRQKISWTRSISMVASAMTRCCWERMWVTLIGCTVLTTSRMRAPCSITGSSLSQNLSVLYDSDSLCKVWYAWFFTFFCSTFPLFFLGIFHIIVLELIFFWWILFCCWKWLGVVLDRGPYSNLLFFNSQVYCTKIQNAKLKDIWAFLCFV